MYLVYASLQDDKWTEDSHIMVKMERLQSFDITTMKGSFEVEPAQNVVDDSGRRDIERQYDYVCMFTPEKGGQFEEHLYQYRDVKDFHNESILALFVISDQNTACNMLQTLFAVAECNNLLAGLSKAWDEVDDRYSYGFAYFAIKLGKEEEQFLP